MNKNYPPVNQMDQKQKVRIVKDIFSSITNKYDFLNFLSLRQDVVSKENCHGNAIFKSYNFQIWQLEQET